jgi:hypothetical protein
MPAETFHFPEEVLRFAAVRTRRRFALALVATGAIVVAGWLGVLRAQGAGWGTLAFSLGLLLAFAALSMRRRMRRMHQRWASFAVTIEDDHVRREVAGYAPILIARSDVAAVEERPAGIVVRDRAGAALLVPRDLDGYARAREVLSGWRPGAAPAR